MLLSISFFYEIKSFSALSVLICGLFRCLSVHYWESCSYPTTILHLIIMHIWGVHEPSYQYKALQWRLIVVLNVCLNSRIDFLSNQTLDISHVCGNINNLEIFLNRYNSVKPNEVIVCRVMMYANPNFISQKLYRERTSYFFIISWFHGLTYSISIINFSKQL